MSKHKTLNTDHFLNRIALDEMANVATIDPVYILDSIFRFLSLGDMQDMFKNLCLAALSEKYDWKEGSAGNLLFFSEKLEQLIEACFLIHARQKTGKQLVMKKKSNLSKNIPLSTRLSEKEWLRPLAVLDEFFSAYPLPGWKFSLHCWTEAGLSNYSVSAIVNPPEILSFYHHIDKLVEAAYWIMSRSKRK